MPSHVVCLFSSTTGPLVLGSISTPAFLLSSFSGIRPTESIRVSHSIYSSVPSTGLSISSTRAMVTPSTLSLPWTWVTVCLSLSGISKSLRHWTILRVSPPESSMISQTAFTSAPSNVILLAMIRPISPDPKMTIFLPGIYPFMFTNFCAVPAVITPEGLSPARLRAPLGLSLHPIASTTASAFILKHPVSFIHVTILSLDKSVTVVSVSSCTPSSKVICSYLSPYSGPVSSSLNLCSPNPLWMHCCKIPPALSSLSMRTTFWAPAFFADMAALIPAGPPPITATSA